MTARYVDVTGDADILKIEIPFLTGAELEPGEHDRYALFDTGPSASLFEHCARALDRMVAVGSHGLPLIGTGDWNDGMDRVGDEGRGESVWLAWFEIATTGLFAPLADAAGEGGRADRWRRHAEAVRGAIHDVAWDGAWFLRAFDDERRALGLEVQRRMPDRPDRAGLERPVRRRAGCACAPGDGVRAPASCRPG